MDLHKELLESGHGTKKTGGWRASSISLALHGVLIAGIVYAGTHTAPQKAEPEKPIAAFITQGAAPPPPPPPPPPPASSGAARPAHVQPKPVEIPKPVQTPKLTQPRQIPKDIPKVEMPVTTSPVVDPGPIEELPASGMTSASAAGNDDANGVVGGVTGGVAGGVVGGEVGGVVGGTIGGVKGGELGGKVGGELGGKGTGTEGEGTGSPADASGPLRVGGDVKAPVAIDRADPLYTEGARKARISGIVILEAIIDKQGNVDNVRVIKGLPLGLSEEAERAVKKWRFRPGTLNGQPVATIFNLTVNFKLD
jgi:periplasmic protein TonB